MSNGHANIPLFDFQMKDLVIFLWLILIYNFSIYVKVYPSRVIYTGFTFRIEQQDKIQSKL